MWIRKPDRSSLSIVFIHGVLSSRKCWNHPNGAFWPDILEKEKSLKGAGIYVFEYKTGIFSRGYSLSDAANDLRSKMDTDGITACEKIIFVCHSMGGIIARRFIVKNQIHIKESKKKIGLFLLGSPSIGSKYANIITPIAFLLGHSQVIALRQSPRNTFLADLDKDFIDILQKDKDDKEYISVHGQELIEDKPITIKFIPLLSPIVEPYSGAKYFGNSQKIANSDHYSISKINNKENQQHKILMAFIHDHFTFDQKMPHAPHEERGSHLFAEKYLNVPIYKDAIRNDDEVKRLMDLAKEKFLVSVEGISGSGKTYLVSTALQQCSELLNITRIFWIDCTNNESFDEIISRLFMFKFDQSLSRMARAKRLIEWLETEKFLLVLDDIHCVNSDSISPLVRIASTMSGPCRLLVIGQSCLFLGESISIEHHILHGFNYEQISTLLDSRRLFNLTEDQKIKLIDITEGVPFTISLFISLIKDFGHRPDQLLQGTISADERLKDWCNTLLSRIDENDQQLFKGLSLVEGLIDRQIVNCVAVALNIHAFEDSFTKILGWHLLHRKSDVTWKMHHILAAHCRDQTPSNEARAVLGGLGIRLKGSIQGQISAGKRGSAILAEGATGVRYLIMAGKVDKAIELVEKIAPEAKSAGAFGLLLSLIEQIIATNTIKEMSPWLAYHYAHCLQVLGNVNRANKFLVLFTQGGRKRDAAAALSCSRLLAETYLELEQPGAALQILEEAEKYLSQNCNNLTLKEQYWCARSRAALDNNNIADAEKFIKCTRGLSNKEKPSMTRAVLLMHISIIETKKCNLKEANLYATEAHGIFKSLNNPRGFFWSGIHLEKLRIKCGLIDDGIRSIIQWARMNAEYEFAMDKEALLLVRNASGINEADRQLIENEIKRLSH